MFEVSTTYAIIFRHLFKSQLCDYNNLIGSKYLLNKTFTF